MKPETKMNKILNNPEYSIKLKILKLQNLALRCIPSSPIQKKVREKYTELENEIKNISAS